MSDPSPSSTMQVHKHICTFEIDVCRIYCKNLLDHALRRVCKLPGELVSTPLRRRSRLNILNYPVRDFFKLSVSRYGGNPLFVMRRLMMCFKSHFDLDLEIPTKPLEVRPLSSRTKYFDKSGNLSFAITNIHVKLTDLYEN
jgi:hypothetical protein